MNKTFFYSQTARSIVKSLLIGLFLMAPTMLSARPVSQKDARRAAQSFWQHTMQQRGTLTSTSLPIDGIYLFSGANGGFVLMSSDDAVRPVLGYAYNGKLDPNNIPVQLAELLEHYRQQILVAQEMRVAPAIKDSKNWDILLKGGATKGSGDIEPLLETLWDQSPYYNKYCPNNTVTGCAATAQAQLMRYYNWPPIGNGSHTYVHSEHGKLSADFGNTQYQWELMPTQLDYFSSEEEVDAVATLIYHVGISIEMDYGYAYNGGSGAIGLTGIPGIPCIDNSLRDYFYYNPQLKPIFKDNGYNDSTWASELIAELKEGHPILYCGTSTAGGHAFVCDGYEKRLDGNYFHFNFGWSGIGDAYFTVDDISPNVSPTGEIGNTYTFKYANQALLGGYPDYQMLITKKKIDFVTEGGTDSVFFAANPQSTSPWSIVCSEPWVTLSNTSFENHGTVYISVEANTSGAERIATIYFLQGNDTLRTHLVQTYVSEEDMCPLTVEMESTRGLGWRGGAHLSFESLNGYVYSSATLEAGSSSTTTVNVAAHDLNIIFVNGGPTDREINYTVKNQYGEVLVNVEYAYRNGGTHFVEWPCSHVGIDDTETTQVSLVPNPVIDRLSINGLTPGNIISLVDMTGSTLLRSTARSSNEVLATSTLPSGIYLLTIDERPVGKVVKM